MNDVKRLFGLNRCALIGMVHLRPLPGSANWSGSVDDILEAAMEDARALVAGGCDALLVENMGDLPYLKGTVHPETVAAMTVVTTEVVGLGLPVGVQILAGANMEALGVATVSGAQFIRVEGFAYAHVADEGVMDACAGPLVRARSDLGADVAIWADVQKKHAAHALTGDLQLEALAEGSVFCGADALVVTGQSTGKITDPADVLSASCAERPVLVGSGITDANICEYRATAAGVIVGSWLKSDGRWRSKVDEGRVHQLKKRLTAQ